MALWASRGVNQYVVGEAHTAAAGRYYKENASRRPVIYFPGGVGGDRKFLDDAPNGAHLSLALAAAGYPMISAAFGGPSLWGNATTATRIGEAWTQVKSELTTKTDKMLLIGASQGATAALNYAKANPNNVAAIVGLVPAIDIQDIYDNNREGNAAAISAAHGGRPPDSLNPADNTASFAGIPIYLFYASDDTVCIASTITDFAAATGARTYNLGAVGHTAATVPAGEVTDFLYPYSAEGLATSLTGALRNLSLAVEITTSEGRVYTWDADSEADSRPTGVSFRTQRGEGFADCSLSLARRVDLDYADLNLLDTLRLIAADGTVAYEGRVVGFPRSTDDGQRIQVQAVGFMSSLRDRPMQEIYVDRSTSSWREPTLNRRVRIAAETPAQTLDAHFTASANQESLSFESVTDATVTVNSQATLMYVMPEGLTASAIQYQGTEHNITGVYAAQLYSADDDTLTLASWTSDALTLDDTLRSLTLTPRKFLLLRMAADATAAFGSNPRKFTYKKVAVYGSHGLTLRDNGTEPDGVYASDVISDLLARFAPKLSDDGVEATSFVVSHLAFPEPTAPYDVLMELNRYHNYNVSVWEGPTLHFAPADLTDYDWQVRTDDPGVRFSPQGDSVEELANGIVVTFTDVWGTEQVLTPETNTELADTSESNPANKHGIERWTQVQVPFPTVESDAVRFGQVALEEFTRAKAPGTISVDAGVIQDRQGNWRPGYEVREGQTIAITNHPNDAPRLITETSWDADEKRLVIEVEQSAPSLEAVFARVELARLARGRG